MEFLRFGSSIPGSYWGCCACCIIQNFNFDPDDKYSIEIVSGDGGEPIGDNFLGKTYREVFESRLRIGTFNTEDMPNHAFLAILTEYQLTGAYGNKWLRLLKENGFEFIRSFDNSVYTGPCIKGKECYGAKDSMSAYEGIGFTIGILDDDDDDCERTHANYLFGMFRNIGNAAISNPFQPPKAWMEIEGGVKEVYEYLPEYCTDLQQSRDEIHLASWERIGPAKMYERSTLEAENIPVWLAGRRSKNPQEKAKYREDRQKKEAPTKKSAPFAAKT